MPFCSLLCPEYQGVKSTSSHHVRLSSISLETLKKLSGASLVAQQLRIRLPMQGTRVRSLVWEDPTCRRATGPVSHNY
ncbi:hypothetical protein J1605_019105 [Eschrichtius robustus]|uniref:Uncharacterized protein n=1 Tax=Eschrichtius robustus TaxID=9764 RepID=A0AB34HSP0_ESCRO|nr:hypothetical protein J1605_019105 [Eschrichtius robustus]